MNEQLESAVVKILERAISGIDSSVEFMQAELPDVIEQLLSWYMVKGIMTVAEGVFFVIPLIVLIRLYSKQDIKGAQSDSFWVDYSSYSENKMGAGVAVSGIFLVIFAAMGVCHAFDGIREIFKIWIAPKIWLMEYAASLVK